MPRLVIGTPNMPISALASVPKSGGPSVQLAVAVFPFLAASEAFLYWADLYGTIDRLPIGDAGAVQHVGGHWPLATGIAVDDTSVYSVDVQYNLNRQPIDGGTPVVLAFAPLANSIAVGATSAYWTSHSLSQAPTPSQPEGILPNSSWVEVDDSTISDVPDLDSAPVDASPADAQGTDADLTAMVPEGPAVGHVGKAQQSARPAPCSRR